MGTAVDGRADLYALGIVLYELLTGKAPFAEQEGPLALMYQHLHAAPSPLPESIPVGLRLQVERLLAKNPDERPANALLVRQALEAALNGEETRLTVRLTPGREAAPALTAGEPGGEPAFNEAEPETLMPRTLLQPVTVVQPPAVATRSRPRGVAMRRYGAIAGSVLVLGVVLGGLWYRFRHPAEEIRQEAGVTQETLAPPPPQEGGTQPSPPEQNLPQQAKVEPPKSAEQIRQEAEERKQAELAQRVADLLGKANTQKTAKRLTTPKGDNAMETYRELLQIAPEHAAALAGMQEIKAQYRQQAEEAQQRGEWAKAQGHYETALKIDPQDDTLRTALQQVKEARKQATAIAGWYETTTSTPVLKEPRPGAPVLTQLSPQKRVYVAGAVGDYMRVESKKGNPPGYIARQDVTPASKESESPGEKQQVALKKPIVGPGQQPTVKEMSHEEARIKLQQMGILYSENAFIESAGGGNTSTVELFLAAGMNPNAKPPMGDTALMGAAYGGHTNMVKMLIAKGANVNEARDKDGLTALMAAAEEGQSATVQALIAGGADVNAKSNAGTTALIAAAEEGQTATVQALIAGGADVSAKSNAGTTALMFAARKGQTATVQALIAGGADVNAKSNAGTTALTVAAREGHTEIVQLLGRAGSGGYVTPYRPPTTPNRAGSGGYVTPYHPPTTPK